MDKMNCKKSKLPNFDGNIILIFPKEVVPSQIATIFSKDMEIQTYDNMFELSYVEVKNFCSWEVNDLLTKLFSQCNFEVLSFVRNQFNAKVVVDIAFYHYDKYPSLLFEGKNMEIIHMLEADISIDAY